MTGSIIWMVCVCAVGLIFFAISNYAEKKKTPMWFITGGLVSQESVDGLVDMCNGKKGGVRKLINGFKKK